MKVAAALVVLLLIVYVLAVAWPAPPYQRSTPGGDWRTWLGDLLQPEFDYADITSACLDRKTRVFQATPICASHVKASRPGGFGRFLTPSLRFLKLSFSNTLAVVSFKPEAPDDSGLPAGKPVTLKPSNASMTVVVPSAGGTLTISCSGSPSCSVQGH